MKVTPWQSDSADIKREEKKRQDSPCSFFFSQGKALVLAANYVAAPGRLTGNAGTARKHLHRFHLALYGQLLASLEYMFKDFVAQVIDLVPVFDQKIKKADWIKLNSDHVLLGRSTQSTPGAILLHPTMGWQDPAQVNTRYNELFGFKPIADDEITDLRQLWILRHSVAHNAGFVTAFDASRAGLPELAEKVADISETHIEEAFKFLCAIAERLANTGGKCVVRWWLKSLGPAGADYQRDKETYKSLKLIGTLVKSRTRPLPSVTKGAYTKDFKEANPN